MSDRHYSISLDTIYLTSNGQVSGAPCRIREVVNIDKLLMSRVGNTKPTANGSAFVLTVPNLGKNVALSFTVNFMVASVFNSIKTLFDNSLINKTNFPVTINGTPGVFNLTCIPEPQSPIQFGEFSGGIYKNVTIRLVTI